MIHEAECHIVLESGTGMPGFVKAEPPIPTDAQIEQTFPGWKLRVPAFINRCAKEEHKTPGEVTTNDFFRYGMKFMICESTKLC